MDDKRLEGWHWEIDESTHRVTLYGFGERGKEIVMDFVRYGMQGAQPRFNVNGIMCTAEECAIIVPGQEHNSAWYKTISNPTAELIASIPTLTAELTAARTEIERLKAAVGGLDPKFQEALNKCTTACDRINVTRQSESCYSAIDSARRYISICRNAVAALVEPEVKDGE